MPYVDPFAPYTGLSRQLLGAQPEAAWSRFLAGFPGGQNYTSPFYNWARPQYGDYLKGYESKATQPGNWDLSWLDYLRDIENPFDVWSELSPEQRGERPGYLGRPSMYQLPR